MMKGFPEMYASFSNTPVHIVVDGEQAAVVSHISAVTTGGDSVEAEVCNYFRISGDLIRYMSNFHDSVPFAAVMEREARVRARRRERPLGPCGPQLP